MVAGALEIQIFAGIARLAKDMADAKRTVETSMRGIESAVSSAKTALGALGIGVGVGGLAALVKSSIDAADHLNNLSKVTKLAVEDLAGLQLLAKQTGTDLDGLVKGMSKMSVEVGKAPAAFKALGITAKDEIGQLKQLADILNLLPDINQRNAVAQKAMGKSWAELAPAFAEGSKGIQAAIDKGKALSGMTKEMAEEASKFNSQIAELNTTLGSGMTKAIGPLLPQMQDIAMAMKEAAKEGGLLLAVWVGMGGAIQLLAQEIRKLLGLPMTEIAALTKDADELQKSLAAMSSSVNPGVRARYEEQLGVIKARLELLRHEQQLANEGAAGKPTGKTAAQLAAEKDAARKAANFLTDSKLAAAELKTFEGAMQSLEKQYFHLTHAGQASLLVYETTIGTLKKLTPEHKEELVLMARKIDMRQRDLELMAAYNKALEAENALTDKRNSIIAEQVVDYAKVLDDEKFELELVGKSARELEILNAQRKIELDLRQRIAALPKLDEGATLSQMQANADAEKRLRESARSRSEEAIQNIKTRVDAERDWATGAKQFFNEYTDNATNAALQVKNAFSSGFKALEDTMFEFFRHGKINVTSFVDMIKDSLARLAAQQFTLNIVAQVGGALGLSGGGSGGGGLGIGNLSSLSNLIPGGGLLGSAAAYSAAVPGLSFGGTQAAMLAAQTGSFGAAGLAATAEAGGLAASGALAGAASAIPYVGLALAAYALLSSDSESKAKPGLGWLANSNGYYQFANQDIPGANDSVNAPMFDAYIKDLNDPTKYDQAKLAQFVGRQVDSSTAQGGLDSLVKMIAEAKIVADDASKAVAINNDKRQLEILLMQEQGDATGALAAQRELELAASDESLRGLMKQIYAQQDANAAADALTKSEQELARTRTASVNDATGALRQAYSRESEELQRMADQWGGASKSLRDYASTLTGSVTGITYSTALQQFNAVAISAQGGDLAAMGDLQGAGETFRLASLARSGSALDYARDVSRIRRTVGSAADFADTQESVALQQLDELKTQVSTLIDIDGNLVTVNEAMTTLNAAIDEMKQSLTQEARDTKTNKELLLSIIQGDQSIYMRTTPDP